MCALGLYFARFFVPAESAHLGDTVWIVQLWLALATFACFMKWRFGEPFHFDMRDGAVWALVLAHVVAALIVICTDGQKRAATNLLWEWIGVGVAFSMLKETVSQPDGLRRLLGGLVVVLIVLSGLGLWQHYVWYPEQRALLLEFEQLTPASPRFQELAEQLGPLATISDPTAAFVLRNRLMASTEPIGRFALANVFAGLLAVGVTLLTAALVNALRNRPAIRSTLILATATILVTICLLLSKSRTAWAGVIVGIFVWAGLTFGRQIPRRRGLLIGATLLLTIVVLVTGIALSGGLDRLVVTESLKSMQYRIEYWTGAWGVIQESPLFGVGPGNFRQHYLQYKLPGSSEEILDPHNLVLDVWANGGMLASIGLLLVTACGLRALLRSRKHPDICELNRKATDTAPEVGGVIFDSTLLASGLVACVLLCTHDTLLGLQLDWQLVLLAVSAVVVGLVFRRAGVPVRFDAAATFGAATALLVHLLGQGGIAMPVIGLTLLLILLRVPTDRPRSADVTQRPRWNSLATLTALAATISCVMSATRPVILADVYNDLGHFEARRGNYHSARQKFQDATEADPLDPTPWQALAELTFIDWQRDATPADADFQRGMQYLREAISRDPEHAKLYWSCGQWEMRRFDRTRDVDAVEQATQWLARALSGYPNNARIRADYALALAAAGQSEAAHTEAIRAVQLDDLNIRLGHYDKLLDDDVRERIQAL